MRTLFLLSILLLSLKAQEINIAVAANVSYAIEALKSAFKEEYPDINVRVTLGSSGKLTAQIKNGAPYGLFMSANMRYPEALYDDNLTITIPTRYAQGTLALFSIHDYNLSQGLQLLEDDKIERIAIANPKTAPYGIAAAQALKHQHLYASLEHKFVYGESIAQTLAFAVTAADVGIIAKSALFCEKMKAYKEGKNWVSIDSALYTTIDQGIVLLKYGEDEPAYKMFYDFVLSDKAQKIFKAYGYIVK